MEDKPMLPDGYNDWRIDIISLIEQSKLKAILSVNAQLLTLYWKIGSDILTKQKKLGWGAQVIDRLSEDLSKAFPDDRGYSARNLRNMKRFATEYPDFPIWQVPLAELQKLPIGQGSLAELQTDDNGI